MIASASSRGFGSSAEHAATPRRLGRGWAVFAALVCATCAACADERAADGGMEGALAGRGAARLMQDTDWPPSAAEETPSAANTEDAFRTLVDVDWELAPGIERYLCARVTASEDMYLNAFRPLAPLGTHHNALSVVETPDAPDGVTECNVATVGPRNVYGSGVGSVQSNLPDGVAMKVAAGSQLLLNLHIFNVSDQPLRGHSGVQARVVAAEQVRWLADGLAAGPLALDIPPGRSTQSGHCTIENDVTLYRVTPHMHQTGVAMKVTAHSSISGDVVLYDGPYDFDKQLAYPFDMLRVNAGDIIDIECTYENTTGATLHWGESTRDEMCFAGLGRFPAGGRSTCPQ